MKDLTAVYPIANKVSTELVSDYLLKRGFDIIFASLAILVWFIWLI